MLVDTDRQTDTKKDTHRQTDKQTGMQAGAPDLSFFMRDWLRHLAAKGPTDWGSL